VTVVDVWAGELKLYLFVLVSATMGKFHVNVGFRVFAGGSVDEC
jgi:hypothetical protein